MWFHGVWFCERRAIETVDEGFRDYAIAKQDFLGDEEKLKRVLNLIPDENILHVTVLQSADNHSKCTITVQFFQCINVKTAVYTHC